MLSFPDEKWAKNPPSDDSLREMAKRNLVLALLLLAACKEKSAPPPVEAPAKADLPVQTPAKAPAFPPNSCVVMDFGDKTFQRLGKVATEEMDAVVRATNHFPMIDRAEFKRRQPGLESAPMPDPLNPASLAILPGADWLVLGSLTKFELVAVKPPAGGTQDPNTTRVKLTVGLELRFVYSATGEVLARKSGDVVQENTASAWRIRMLGIGGGSRNEIQTDSDTQKRLLRMVLEEEFKKMLPAIRGRLQTMGAPRK